MQCVENSNYEKLTKAIKLVNEQKIDKDRFSSWLFIAYKANHISRREYHDLFNELEKNLHHFCNDRELNNVVKRMDWRTLGEFALMIYDNTRREKILAEAWVEMCKKQNLLTAAVLRDNGMANNGQLVFGLSGVNHEPDYKIGLEGSNFEIPSGTHKLEIKYSPSSIFLTYKAKDLESYIQRNAYVLTIMGENRMLGANGKPEAEDTFDITDLGLSWWAVMTPTIMKKMLHDLPVKRFQGYMGNKPSVRLYRDASPNFKDYFEMRNWPQ